MAGWSIKIFREGEGAMIWPVAALGPGDLFIFVSNSSGPDHCGPVSAHRHYLSPALWWRSPGSRHHFQIPKLAIHWTYFVTLKFNALSPVSAQLLEGLGFGNWTSLIISFNWTKSFWFIRGCWYSQVPKSTGGSREVVYGGYNRVFNVINVS